MNQNKLVPLYLHGNLFAGDLVEIVKAPDQNQYMMKDLWGKMGIIIEKVNTNSSPNIWKVLVGDKTYNLHKLDFKKLNY